MSLFSGEGPASLDLDVPSADGSPDEPTVLVHRLDEHTWLLRQSLRTTYEAPFVYLLMGDERALLLDSGATGDSTLRDSVDGVLAEWLRAHPRDGYRLVVAHTHAHGDHIAGDAAFAARPDTEVVGTDVDAVRHYFGLRAWPAGEASFDLGGRVLTVLPAPGHHATHLAVHDPWTGLLFTGDTVYPGRLYVVDDAAFADTLDRLVALAAARGVTHLLGAHVEMSRRPGRDFALGSVRHRDEVSVVLDVDTLVRVRAAARDALGRPGVHAHGQFEVWNGPCRGAVARQLLRLAGLRLLRRG